MTTYKKIQDDKHDFFLSAIPQWITHIGFYMILGLFASLLFFSMVFRYPTEKTLAVVIQDKTSYTISSFDEFKNLKNNQFIEISIPTLSKKLPATIVKNEAWIEEDKVYSPIYLNDSTLRILQFKTKILCKGNFLSEQYTLWDKIWE